jgi:hypothetical protein
MQQEDVTVDKMYVVLASLCWWAPYKSLHLHRKAPQTGCSATSTDSKPRSIVPGCIVFPDPSFNFYDPWANPI